MNLPHRRWKFSLFSSAVAGCTAILLLAAPEAHAGSKWRKANDKAAEVARDLSRTRLGNKNPHVWITKKNVQIYDRLGWEAGRYMSVKKHGPAGDPGRYPGLKRRN